MFVACSGFDRLLFGTRRRNLRSDRRWILWRTLADRFLAGPLGKLIFLSVGGMRMPRDEEFHELATRFPEAALLLLGIEPAGHEGRSIELKQSKRRVDVVFVPRTAQGEHVLTARRPRS